MNGRIRLAASMGAAVFVTGALLSTASFATASTEQAVCNGEVATIVGQPPGGGPILGTPGQDVIVGTNGPDVIVADDGFDTVCGRGGNDEIFGGDQGDNLFGERGNDVIWGGDDFGVDFIAGQEGRRDKANAGPGVDTCTSTTERQVQCELP